MAIKTYCHIKDKFDVQKRIVDLYIDNVHGKVPQFLNEKSFNKKNIAGMVNASETSVKNVLQAWFNIGKSDDSDALNEEYIKLTNGKKTAKRSLDKKQKSRDEVCDSSSSKETEDEIENQIEVGGFKRLDPNEYLATIIPSNEWYGIVTIIQELIEHREITTPYDGMHGADNLVPQIRKLLAPYTLLNPHNGNIEPFSNFVTFSKSKGIDTEIKPHVVYEGLIEEVNKMEDK
tara:strand:+ start:537 stop:1232 length:696 start_codon:yes stop_codon:yes gene_type:complete